MRDKIIGLLAVSICSTLLLAIPARADSTRDEDEPSAAQVDPILGDVGKVLERTFYIDQFGRKHRANPSLHLSKRGEELLRNSRRVEGEVDEAD